MTTASLRILPLPFALALGLAATIASAGIAPACAATLPPMAASDTGWQSELVNRPSCGSGGDYEIHPACEAGCR